MDANDTICLCVANDFVQAEKRTSSPLLRFSTSPLLHFSASPLCGWTDGRIKDFVQADADSSASPGRSPGSAEKWKNSAERCREEEQTKRLKQILGKNIQAKESDFLEQKMQ
jgi:hypothetical protein